MAPAPCVLVVDDDAHVLSGVSLTLRHSACRVLTALGGSAGLECLAQEPVAVVISDEHMPGMSGTAFLTEVRKRHPGTIRMVLSGSSDPQAIARAVNEASLFRYLLKPCTPGDLTLAVDQAIEAHTKNRFSRRLISGIDLDDAIRHLRFEMQPLFAQTGTLLGHEALLRLPSRFSAGAPDVLAAAEEQDRLWEVERAIRTTVGLRIAKRPEGSTVFVNIHPRTLLDPQIYTRGDGLAAHASAVVLELTERGSLSDIDDLSSRIDALRTLGYRIAIDDMGSGYSGLTTFANVLPDFVKFDRELTQGAHGTPAKRHLMSSIAAVCHGLGIATVAEGIETPADLEAARAVGCIYLQGYLLGRPAHDFAVGPFTL